MKNSAPDNESGNSLPDSGFGLVEIIISMFLLTLLSLAFLPLLIDSLRATVRNSITTTASQLLAEQLDRVPTLDRTCAAVASFAAEPDTVITDDRGNEYRASRMASSCPTGPNAFPGRLIVTLEVEVIGQPEIVVQTRTFALVEAAS